MFFYGDTLPALRHPVRITYESRIAINLSPDAIGTGDIAGLARRAYERFPSLMYYAQNLVDAELLYWGDTSQESGDRQAFPLQLSHPLLREDKVRVPVDPATWISELRSYDFVYGTRIHGNIAALLAGTPSVVLVHDSRTLELSRYFELPHRMLRDVPAGIDPQELADAADYASMFAGHHQRFSRLSAFLGKNSLDNTYDHGDKGAAFDAHIAELDLPGCIGVWDGSDDGGLRYRLAWLREQILASRSAAAQRNAELAKTTAGLRQRNQDLLQRLDAMEKRLTATEQQVARIERHPVLRMGRAVRRGVRLITNR